MNDSEGKGLTKAGVAVLVGSLVMLILAFPAVLLLQRASVYTRPATAVAAMPAVPATKASLTYARSGKDVTVTLKIKNWDAADLEHLILEKLEVDHRALVKTPLSLGTLKAHATIIKTFTIKNLKKGDYDEDVTVSWGKGTGYGGSESSGSFVSIP